MEKAPGPPPEKEVLAKRALHAIRVGNGEELKKILLAGADPNVAPTSGIKNEAANTLLYHAVAKQDESLVNILIEEGADINGSKAVGLPPLRAAVVRNNEVLVKLLLSRGANVNHRYTIVSGSRKETKTVLFETATSSTYEFLIKSGADVNTKNSWHETPLHFQAYNWNSRLVRALVAAGADVNAMNKKNVTPLDNALFRKPSHRKSDDEEFMEVCRILLRNKATVPWSNPDQYFQSKAKPDSDAKRYHNALTAATDSMDQTVDDRVMDAFAETHIFRWVRMICAHHPQAEFAFLGTKADLVGHDRRKIMAIQHDIVYRFKSNIRRMKDRVQRAQQELEDAKFEIQDSDPGAETTELDDQIDSCEEMIRKQPVLLSEELIVFSSADLKGESIARGKLKALLMMSGSSVLLPPSYAELLKHAQQRYVEFITSVVNSSKLIIPEEEMLAALHLLHDTGDIVWFDGVSDVRLLKERLFLDPMLVIEFIRQIVNHKAVTMAALVATGAADLPKGVYLTETYGGPHGDAYSDVGRVFAGQVVKSITVCSGDRVDGVGLEVEGLSDQLYHGGRHGSTNTRTLATGENVISMEVHWDKHDSHTRIFFVNFTTSLGNSIVGGTPVPDPNHKAKVAAQRGYQLGGFVGYAGRELDSVGALWTQIGMKPINN
ncbi:Vps9-Ankyrin repeat-containing protein [Phytophthora cinnamomi]|uniref:Vps9-Ankyrin repeat-containing protein n=1 Tax=Phytophthora cinnamomi TaxID=4785 RepID=UPI0035595B8B|nr:Vps9-Ankyrin repeat-containing protein [Phytophthora cinnamomi]